MCRAIPLPMILLDMAENNFSTIRNWKIFFINIPCTANSFTVIGLSLSVVWWFDSDIYNILFILGYKSESYSSALFYHDFGQESFNPATLILYLIKSMPISSPENGEINKSFSKSLEDISKKYIFVIWLLLIYI